MAGRHPLTSLALVALVALAACASDDDDPSQAGGSTTTTTATSTTTLSAAKAEVTAAYREFWDVVLLAADPPDPEHPRLDEVATGEQRRTIGGRFVALLDAGQVLRGSIDVAPEVIELSSDRATLRDCYDDHILAYDAATGAPRDEDDPRRHLVLVTLVFTDGRWKVTSITPEDTAGEECVPRA